MTVSRARAVEGKRAPLLTRFSAGQDWLRWRHQ